MTSRGPRRRHQPRLSNFQLGAIIAALVVVGGYLGFRKSIPFRHHYSINAVFSSGANIHGNSQVRIAGVNVGKVESVEPVADGASAVRVKMRITNQGLPLHRDATAKIRPRIFLEGSFFIDLQPGSPSSPLIDDGDTIPASQTAVPVQWDQIFTTLQSDTRTSLQDLLQELARALETGGAVGFNRSIPYWKPAYKSTAIVADALLGTTRHDLSGFVDKQGAVSQALTRDEPALKALITDLNTTARAFAAADGDLSAAVGELPRTLRAGEPALAALDASFPALRRFVAAARPAVRSTGPAVDALTPLVVQLRGLVGQPELRGLAADLNPAAPALARLTRRTTGLLGQVRLASSCQNEVVLPWTKDKISDPDFPATRNVGEEATKFLPGIAGESRSGDANGQWFRILANLGGYAYPLAPGQFFLTDSPLRGVNPTKPATRPPLVPDVPCETQQQPDLRTIPGAAPAGMQAVIPRSKLAAYQKLQDKAVSYARRVVDAEGLKKLVRVSTKPLTKDGLAQLLRSVKR